MPLFSEESLLLIQNWDAVAGIMNAQKRLQRELSSILDSIRASLPEYDWWQDGWMSAKIGSGEMYISRRDWRAGGEYVVWVGIGGFAPERIFGEEPPPICYVYVSGTRYVKLAVRLAERIAKEETEVLGELDRKADNGYVVRYPVSQCLPEEVEQFAESVTNQITHFIDHYTRILPRFDDTIQECLGEVDRG